VTAPRFLIDENLSPTLVEPARERGFEAIHVNHLGLRTETDWDLLKVIAGGRPHQVAAGCSDGDYRSGYDYRFSCVVCPTGPASAIHLDFLEPCLLFFRESTTRGSKTLLIDRRN
jgi:hypothetical protein